MGRPPAVVIVARHGARLDAADAQWHLTSPTPYDPPLTYGGWRQSQALGAKIASILHDRETTAGSNDTDQHSGRDGRHDHRAQGLKRRKHRVVIHTSPFLRCVQTSIAISAGLAQQQEAPRPISHQSHVKPHSMHSGSPQIHAMDHRNSPRLSAILEPDVSATQRSDHKSDASRVSGKALLRVDAFLGEWLSPDYFEKITPPPGSKMMLASAKGDLLRDKEPFDTVPPSSRNASGNFPGGWGSSGSLANRSDSSDEETLLVDMSSISKTLPRISRANSHHIGEPRKMPSVKLTSHVQDSYSQNAFYVAPIPSYAISPSQPIPQGYVAHARDACVKVDIQWDSMRRPLEWGNGGGFGEEWSAMHKRFRRGFYEMISWYRSNDMSITLEATADEIRPLPTLDIEGIDGDDEVDTVLVLVTHGAGCNALIGALTNQPVLIDVGMASLTMAVKKSVDYKRVASPTHTSASPPRRRHSVIDYGISDDYEVKLVASTEHLRAGSPFLAIGNKLQQAPSLLVRAKSPYRYERPGFALPHHASHNTSNSESHSSLVNLTPTRNALEATQPSATAITNSASGLWSMPPPKKMEDTDKKHIKQHSLQAVQNGPVKTLDGASEEIKSDLRTDGAIINGTLDARVVKSSFKTDGQGRSIIPNGLWGAPPQALGTERDRGAKRRWTLSQAAH